MFKNRNFDGELIGGDTRDFSLTNESAKTVVANEDTGNDILTGNLAALRNKPKYMFGIERAELLNYATERVLSAVVAKLTIREGRAPVNESFAGIVNNAVGFNYDAIKSATESNPTEVGIILKSTINALEKLTDTFMRNNNTYINSEKLDIKLIYNSMMKSTLLSNEGVLDESSSTDEEDITKKSNDGEDTVKGATGVTSDVGDDIDATKVAEDDAKTIEDQGDGGETDNLASNIAKLITDITKADAKDIHSIADKILEISKDSNDKLAEEEKEKKDKKPDEESDDKKETSEDGEETFPNESDDKKGEDGDAATVDKDGKDTPTEENKGDDKPNDDGKDEDEELDNPFGAESVILGIESAKYVADLNIPNTGFYSKNGADMLTFNVSAESYNNFAKSLTDAVYENQLVDAYNKFGAESAEFISSRESYTTAAKSLLIGTITTVTLAGLGGVPINENVILYPAMITRGNKM